MNTKIATLTSDLKELKLKSESDLLHCESNYRSDLERLHKARESDLLRIQQLEIEKETYTIRKREFDANLQKISELENRIKSQDNFFKKRLLSERFHIDNNQQENIPTGLKDSTSSISSSTSSILHKPSNKSLTSNVSISKESLTSSVSASSSISSGGMSSRPPSAPRACSTSRR